MPDKDRKQRTEKGDGKGIRDTCSRYPYAVGGWLFVGCALGAVAVMNFIPRFKGPGHEVVRYDEPAGSTVFSGVRIPPETVPVSLGRAIGSHSESQPLNAQVGSEFRVLAALSIALVQRNSHMQQSNSLREKLKFGCDEIENKGGPFDSRALPRFGCVS